MSDAAGTGQGTTGAETQQTADGNNAGQGGTAAGQQTTQPGGDAGQQGDGQSTQQTSQEVSYELKMPDGIELDKAAADEFIPLAKELGLKPEQAQKIADIQARAVQRQVEAWQSQQAAWVDELRADPQIGGDKFDESIAVARQGIEFVGDPALKELLKTTGYGNHPVLVRAFYKIGKQLAPDSFVGGKSAPAQNSEEAALAKMYPTMAKGA